MRSKVAAIFDRINEGDYSAMVDALAPAFEYRFHGEHALGGRRTTVAAMNRWWQRIFRLLPGVRFDIREVLVDGSPWRTRVAVRAEVAGELPGGALYRNTVFQFLTLAWGRVTSVETLEDLQVLEAALHAVGDAGNAEALADPETD
ncbi:nuclear transport factor 2 family protein [Microbacterium sp.]|uniref:nuclear transport factor 2 family protein n=1 Tax=Microbacterium sp. TaxID=51671 RepID=UPI003A837F5F